MHSPVRWESYRMCRIWSRGSLMLAPKVFKRWNSVVASRQGPERHAQRPRCLGLGAQPPAASAMFPVSPPFVGSTAGATSDLSMACDRARVLLQGDERPGSAVASKVGSAPSPLPSTLPPLAPHPFPATSLVINHAACSQVQEERGGCRDALRGLPLLGERLG